MITLKDNSIELSQDTIDFLNAKEGDKIQIGYVKKDGVFIPILNINKETGNKLSKSNTFAFKGRQHARLAQLGTTFELVPTEYGLELRGDGIISEFNTIIPFEPEPLDKEIILDTNYKLTKFEKYEL